MTTTLTSRKIHGMRIYSTLPVLVGAVSITVIAPLNYRRTRFPHPIQFTNRSDTNPSLHLNLQCQEMNSIPPPHYPMQHPAPQPHPPHISHPHFAPASHGNADFRVGDTVQTQHRYYAGHQNYPEVYQQHQYYNYSNYYSSR